MSVEAAPPADVEHPGAEADFPTEIPLVGWKQIVMRIREQFKRDHATLTAAGVAFFGFLALIPLLGAAVSIYGIVADPDNVRRLVERIEPAVPAELSTLLQNQLDGIAASNSGALGLGVVAGLLLGLWSASSGTAHLMEGINIAYDEDVDDRPLWHRRGIALALTLLLMVVLSIAATLVSLTAGLSGFGGAVATLAVWATIAGLLSVLLAIYYRFGTDRPDHRWRWLSPGAVFAVVVWTIASFLFSFYVANFGSYNETYGSLGAIVVVLLWLYVSALVVIIGAELNNEIERQAGATPVEESSPTT